MHPISYYSPKLTPLKQTNLSYQPSQEEIFSYALQVLELTLPADKDILYLAQQALKASLPQDWQACEYFSTQSEQGQQTIAEEESIIVYRNKKTKKVIYDHPLDAVYKEKARELKLIKNTAKYSQNVVPISEQLIESSVVLMNKNLSKNNENESSQSSNIQSSSNLQDSKSKSPLHFPSKTSQLVKNITEESVLYQQDSDQFGNLSMITDYEEIISGRANHANDKEKSVQYKDSIQNKVQRLRHHQNQNKNISNLHKQKPKVIRPIIIPTQKQIHQKKMKQKQHRLKIKEEVKQTIEQLIVQKLLQINNQKMQTMKSNLKAKLTLKQIEQKALIAREFDQNNQSQPFKRLNQKQSERKKLQRQSRILDEKIKQAMRLIELQKSLSKDPLLFHAAISESNY